jgi:CheY-like chemotaxis protein
MPQVLIVDDERFQRLLLIEYLSSDPALTFLQADSGSEALELARTQPVDLILLDMMMPSMDGLEVARQLKGDPALHDIPVILISALPPLIHSTPDVEIPANGFISKPFEEEELISTVKRALDSKGRFVQRQGSGTE